MTTRVTSQLAVPAQRCGPVRIRLHDGPAGPLDGAWWPRSRNLQVEIADLVDHFPPEKGEVVRLLFARPDWDGQNAEHSDHVVTTSRRPVKVSSFAHDDTHRVVLHMRSHRNYFVLVIPPDTPEHIALELMARAADADNRQTSSQLLASLEVRLAPDPLNVWDNEGGHLA